MKVEYVLLAAALALSVLNAIQYIWYDYWNFRKNALAVCCATFIMTLIYLIYAGALEKQHKPKEENAHEIVLHIDSPADVGNKN
jgi:hypothetical protein